MTIKIKASSIFRRNTPGTRIGSIKRMSKYKGQLYSFQYTSWGKYKKGIQKKNLDRYPVILLAYKDGNKVWRARNGKSYIYGFNLNYLSPSKRLETVRYIQDHMTEDIFYTYEYMKGVLRLPTAVGTTIFRKYDVRGGKLKFLKDVDLDKYVAYLNNSIEMKDF